ncbi:hypothetical protein SBBP2_2270003 [Burkholderiales bacterium]|nr:hypothetical protein SBBP2_2270003 [Burkholderiales bacterium]
MVLRRSWRPHAKGNATRCPSGERHYADDLAERIIARERARCSEEMHPKPTTPRSAFA